MALNFRLATLKLFGQFPKTEEYEKRENDLREEDAKFSQFGESDEYKNFVALKEFAESEEPSKLKKDLLNQKYNGSTEHKQELELKSLRKNKAIRNYLQVKDSENLSFYRVIEQSGKPARYEELKEFVNTTEYKSQRKAHRKNNSPEFQKELEFINLQKDSELKRYLKLKKWKTLHDYFELEGSDKIKHYQELEAEVTSASFAERKKYLLSKNKFEQTEAYQKLSEYEALKKSKEIIWFLKLQGSKKFDEVIRWQLTFADEFNSKKLDTNKWLTRYFWGEALIHKGYSLAGDKHAYTDGNNLMLDGTSLKIITKKEQANSLSWDKRYGFFPNSFDFTSGIINTGQSFRQRYGKFEAKVKFTTASNIFHAFWLVGDTMLPHIDIFRQNGGKRPSVQGSIFWQSDDKIRKFKAPLSGFNFQNSYYILGLEWAPNKLTWKINGITYAETTANIPNAPAYLVFSSGVNGDNVNGQLPAEMNIEWVRCWEDTTLEH